MHFIVLGMKIFSLLQTSGNMLILLPEKEYAQ